MDDGRAHVCRRGTTVIPAVEPFIAVRSRMTISVPAVVGAARAHARVRAHDNNIIRCRDDYTYALAVVKAYARDRPMIDTQGADHGNRIILTLLIIYFQFDRHRQKPYLPVSKHIILSTNRFLFP